MQIAHLICEYRSNPLGIDILRPRFSWKLISSRRGAPQRAFQLVAAPNVESFLQDDAVLWDLGKVNSDQSIHIPYAGPALQSRQGQARILESDLEIENSPGLQFIRRAEDARVYELPPGSYRFETGWF